MNPKFLQVIVQQMGSFRPQWANTNGA